MSNYATIELKLTKKLIRDLEKEALKIDVSLESFIEWRLATMIDNKKREKR
jgi:hypothetical protein